MGGGGGGASWARQSTSKSKLNIDWRTPYVGTEQTPSAEELIAELRGADRRPLLIVRSTTKQTDKKVDSLLKAALGSERFQLASKWFHCVKVDEKDIAQSKYRNLFAGRRPAHMVLSSWDGKKRIDLLGNVDQKVTWKKITTVLKRDYKKSPDKAIKVIEKLLNKHDALDKRQSELSTQLARANEKKKKSQVKKVEKQLAKLEKERAKLNETERKARDLVLRHDESTED